MAGNSHAPVPEARHESRDVNARSLTRVGIAFALLIVASLFLVWFVFDFFLATPTPTPARREPAWDARRLPPEPRLQPTPVEDLKQMLAAEQSILNSYAWVDRNQGIARIPVSVAMDLVAQNGLPSQPVPPAPAAATVPSESGLGPIVQQVGGPLNPNRVFPPPQPLEIHAGQAGGSPTPPDRSLANPAQGFAK